VKRYRAADGSVRVWFDPAEIDSLAEDVLQRAGLMPTLQAPVVDVEALVEGYLEADLDQYAPLPREVLGVTEFRSGLPPQVLINRDLTEAAFDAPTPAPVARGRWRATVAHEAAHILLHRVLAEPDFSQTSLLELAPSGVSLPAQRLFRCLRREVAFGGGSDWREVQANRCMAALVEQLFGSIKQKIGSSFKLLREDFSRKASIACAILWNFWVFATYLFFFISVWYLAI
jgi:hypothetical protein